MTYEDSINYFIPEAELHATREAGARPVANSKDFDGWATKWNKACHSKMNDLCFEAGIRGKI